MAKTNYSFQKRQKELAKKKKKEDKKQAKLEKQKNLAEGMDDIVPEDPENTVAEEE